MSLRNPNIVIIALAEKKLLHLFKVTWSWPDGVISTCMISLIWVNSCRYTCLPNLMDIGLMEMEISILTWIPRKKLNSPSRSAILSDFRSLEYRFTIPKPRKSIDEERKGHFKALCFTSNRNKLTIRFDLNEVSW